AGGDLYQDIATQTSSRLQHMQKAAGHFPSHFVQLDSESLLARIVGAGTLRVNSFHHQAVRQVAYGFRTSAVAADGVVEAIEQVDAPFVVGVQWHPERMTQDPHRARLFQAFVEAAGEW